MVQSAIKAFTKINVEKFFKVHSRLWTLEVLGIFQREYYPRCYNHCTSIVSLLLGLITLKASLTNHPK